MKSIILFFLLLLSLSAFGQGVGIGTASPHSSAQLEISTTSKGILLPRMWTESIFNIENPAKGLMVYDTVQNKLMVNMGSPTMPDWRTIASRSSWDLHGNSGTDPITDFIGTTDSKPLMFKVRDTRAGKIDSASLHTFIGYKAGMNTNNTAIYNTAMGAYAYVNNTTGTSNTAVGSFAMNANTTGYMNSAFGVDALRNSTTSNFNVAFGYRALQNNGANSNSAFGNSTLAFNTTGFANTALGSNALVFNSTGSLNVAVGRLAMFSNTSGSNNTGVGITVMNDNTTGYFNAALGDAAMFNNTVGFANTACGSGALYNTELASYNTMIGYHAGFAFNLGWNNTFVGSETNTNDSDLFNSVALGHNVTITASSQARIGNSATSSIGGYTNWSNISDGRFKKNIHEDVKGLDFIMKLRPITYQLDVPNLSARLNENTEHREESKMDIAMAEKESMIQSGFIAQEVEQAATEVGYDFSGVDKPKNENDLYALRYAEFVVPLVKAVQELQQQVEQLRNQLNGMKER